MWLWMQKGTRQSQVFHYQTTLHSLPHTEIKSKYPGLVPRLQYTYIFPKVRICAAIILLNLSCLAQLQKKLQPHANKWNKGTDEARCNWLNIAFILPVSPAASICHDSQTFLLLHELFSNTIHFRVNTNKNLWASKNIDLCFLLTASDQLLVPDSGTDWPLWQQAST